MGKPIWERLGERTDFSGEHFLWQGYRAGNYGRISYRGRQRGVHVIAFEIFNGPVPDGYQVHHECEITLCIRPDHLRAVTPFENLMASDTGMRRNKLKTHCPQGHPYDEENTGHSREGRYCRACHRIRAEQRRQKMNPNRIPMAQRTHCPAGHPYSEENTRLVRHATYIQRRCRTCERTRSLEAYYRRKGAT
jgi:HNH endonuclease